MDSKAEVDRFDSVKLDGESLTNLSSITHPSQDWANLVSRETSRWMVGYSLDGNSQYPTC